MRIRSFFAALLAAAAFHAAAAVDINQASTAELEQVPGIGPALSAKIVKARQAAAFKDWPDVIDRVGGIGPGSAAKLSNAGLTVGGQAYAAGAAPAVRPKREPKAAAEPKAPKAREAAKPAG